MKEMCGNTRFAVVERGISRRLEKACRKRDPVCGNHLAREESIDFYQRIVEDLTGFDVTTIRYDCKREVFQFVFNESYAKDLEINVALDSLLHARAILSGRQRRTSSVCVMPGSSCERGGSGDGVTCAVLF